jgi:hypothetical protein
MGLEVAEIGGDTICTVVDCKKVWKEVDEHQRPGRGWCAIATRFVGCEKI